MIFHYFCHARAILLYFLFIFKQVLPVPRLFIGMPSEYPLSGPPGSWYHSESPGSFKTHPGNPELYREMWNHNTFRVKMSSGAPCRKGTVTPRWRAQWFCPQPPSPLTWELLPLSRWKVHRHPTSCNETEEKG